MDGGFAVADKALAVCKLCHLAGFNLQRASGEFRFEHSEFFKHSYKSFPPGSRECTVYEPFNNKTGAQARVRPFHC